MKSDKARLQTILESDVYAEMRTPLFLRSIQKTPPWANDPIQAWDENYLNQVKPFLRHHYWTSQGSINVFQVVGTAHQQYQNRPWIDLLTSGKRMDINLPLQNKNPQYYRETEIKKPMMYFNTFDGVHYYIGADGNHRTCIAKFMFYETGETQLHGVTINHYDVDEKFFALYQALQLKIRQLNLNVILTAVSECVKREDTAGWMIDCFQTTLLWQAYDAVSGTEKMQQLTYLQAQKKLSELTSEFVLIKHRQSMPKSITQRIKEFFK